jgi:tetratricopeptide (TPR) repeat protein
LLHSGPAPLPVRACSSSIRLLHTEMLAESVASLWRAEISALTPSLPPPDVRRALSDFEQISVLPADTVRRRLVDARPGENRLLARVLFWQALAMATPDPARSRSFADWARFVAQYDAMNQARRQDLVEAHCEFLIGVLEHADENLMEAQSRYLRAEGEYRGSGGPSGPQALAVIAQGVAALDADDLDGTMLGSHHGARDRFQVGLDLARASNLPSLGQLEQLVRRGLRQWDLLGELIEAESADGLLARHRELLDAQFLRLVERRVSNLAVNGTPNRAIRAARLGSRILAGEDDLLERLAAFYEVQKKPDSALEVMQELAAQRPDDLVLKSRIAGMHLLAGRLVESREVIDDVLRQDPDLVDALMLRAQLMMAHDDPEVASVMHRIRMLDPENALAHAYFLGRTPEAEISFANGQLTIHGDVTGLAPDDLAAAMTAAIIAAHPDETESRLTELSATDPQTAAKVARLLGLHQQFPPTQLPPAQFHLREAEQWFGKHQFDEAAAEYRNAICEDPNLAPAYLGLGDVHFMRGQFHLAIAHFEESIAIAPAPATYRFLGDAFLHAERPDDAEVAYRRALELDPDHSGARKALELVLQTRRSR